MTLLDVLAHRARVLAVIRTATGCDLHEAMARAAATPAPLLEDVALAEANDVQVRLESAGGRVEVRTRPPEPAPPPIPKQRDELRVWATPAGGGEPEWLVCPVEGERRGDFGEFDVQAQPCHRCATRGTLASEIPSDMSTCPRCREDTFQVQGGWAT